MLRTLKDYGFPSTWKLLFLVTLLQVTAHLAGAEEQQRAREIVRALMSDEFWTNYPMSIQFTEQSEMLNRTADGTRTNVSVFTCNGLLDRWGSKGVKSLNSGLMPPAGDYLVYRKKVFVNSNDYTMSYMLYSTNAQGSRSNGTRGQDSNAVIRGPGNAGEARFGTPDCRCSERFLPFPMTPEVLAQKLLHMQSLTFGHTNYENEQVIVITGAPTDEPDGMLWSIFLKQHHATWLPIKTEVFSGGQLLSLILCSFALEKPYYAATNISIRVFDHDSLVVQMTWNNIQGTGQSAGDVDWPRIEQVPSRVTVSEYRFSRPIGYVMGDVPPTAEQLNKMVQSDKAILEYERQHTFKLAGAITRAHSHPVKRVIVLCVFGLAALGMGIALLRVKASKA